MTQPSGHDAMRPQDPPAVGPMCHCDLIAKVEERFSGWMAPEEVASQMELVRADEREGTVPLSDWEEAVLALGAAKVELADLRAKVEALRDDAIAEQKRLRGDDVYDSAPGVWHNGRASACDAVLALFPKEASDG